MTGTGRRQTWRVSKAAVRGRTGLVAAQHADAAQVGAEVLAGGGNAVDAAIATALAIGVVEPWMSGLGGGGVMIVAPGDGSPPAVIDFTMKAPAALDPADYPLTGGRDLDLFGWPAVADGRNVAGPLSIAVPGQAAGLELAWREFASMPWAELCRPAIELARLGLPLHWYATLRIAVAARELAPFEAARSIYLPDGLPPLPDAGRLPLGRLAATLERLAHAGPRDLIEGELARALVEDVQAAGGRLSLDDLRANPARRLDAPAIEHGGAVVHAAAGLTAGPTLAHALELARGKVPNGPPGAEAYLAWAEALFVAYAERFRTMGDADLRRDPGSTTHLCVADAAGTMVSVTQTLLSVFGSRIVSPQTGILLNNGIMWFDPRPGGPNSIAPGRRPLSNMCPVIVQRDGRPWLALGASGGRRILPAVLQLTSMLTDCGLDLETAFHTPRIDVSGEPCVTADIDLPEEVLTALDSRYKTHRAEHLVTPNLFACPTGILREADGFVGMTDVIQPVAGVAAA